MLTRRSALKSIALGTLATTGRAFGATTRFDRPNIVLILYDDLNCCISPYNPQQKVFTPNFERLRERGAMFQCAYAAVPACSPSRTAMMLGLAPTTSGILANAQSWKDATPAGTASLFGHFHANGWSVCGAGKLFHYGADELRDSDWTDYWQPDQYFDRLTDLEHDSAASAEGQFDFGPNETAALPDAECAGWIADRIRSGFLDAGGGFLALGLARPHQPHLVPQEWFDRYPGTVEVPPGYWPGSTTLDGNIPDQEDLGRRARRRINAKVADRINANDELQPFLRAYYAATSFADAQLGRVLDALEERQLLDNTFFVVTSDHGYMLGERRDIGKFELREVALQVPLFIAGPGITPRLVPDPVSLVDLYPTLCGLAGLAAPPHCEGQDLSETLLSGAQPPRPYAISYYSAPEPGDLTNVHLYSSIRTADWRLTSYGPANNLLRWLADFGAEEYELYCHATDTAEDDPHEWHNLASARPDIVASLRPLMPPARSYRLVMAEGREEHD